MDIIGQKHVLRYLKGGLARERLNPSLLFVGPEGVGKKTVARELAKALLCQKPRESNEGKLPACQVCVPCQKVAKGIHPDLFMLDFKTQALFLEEEVDSQTQVKIKVVRGMEKFLNFRPLEASKRLAIIEEAHKLSMDSSHALLKILEEPPKDTHLLLIAIDEHSLPRTIQSRCATLRFHPLSIKDIHAWLMKNKNMSPDKANELANLSKGSLSTALALLEEETFDFDFADFKPDEFFDLLSKPHFRSETRTKTDKLLSHLIEKSQRKLEAGDIHELETLQLLLRSRQQLDHFINSRLVLENLYLKLHPEALKPL